MGQEVILVATIQTKSGMRDQLKEDLLKIVNLTRQEAGCLQFEIHEGVKNPDMFVLWEHFASQADFDKHLAMSYTKDYFVKGNALSTDVVTLKRLKQEPT